MVLSVGFIFAFIGSAICLLFGIMIFANVTGSLEFPTEEDPNCNVNYNHHTNCLLERTLYDGSKVGINPQKNIDSSWAVILILPLIIGGVFWKLIGRII